MAYLNENYLKLQSGYLFPEVGRRVREFCEANPKAAKRLIRCGIGDVTEPLPRAAVEAMKGAVDELGHHETFHGYGPEHGYEFLRSAIAQNDYRDRNVEVADDEIFISDGSKCDCGYVLDILGDQNKVALPDPVYPVYVDTNVMAGHTGPSRKDGSYEGILYLACTAENNFVPDPPREHVDLVYLCFPNNPTGAVASRVQLSRWVDYVREHDALLLFDAAYEAYISEADIPHSIFEVPDARECAIEFPRTAGSPACAVGLPCCRNRCSRGRRTVAGYRSIRFGSGVGAPNPTASVTLCNAALKRCIHKKVASKCALSSLITWETPNSFATPSPMPGSRLLVA